MSIQDQSIQFFVDKLHELAHQEFPLDAVRRLLADYVFSSHAFDRYIFYKPDRYTRNLIYKCDDFELLLLGWGSHHKSPIHGHEGEKCWMRVLDGSLCFINYDVVDARNTSTLHQGSRFGGSVGFVDGPAVIHAVENETDSTALSLHLYARPFSQCDVYASEGYKKTRMTITYDSVDGKCV